MSCVCAPWQSVGRPAQPIAWAHGVGRSRGILQFGIGVKFGDRNRDPQRGERQGIGGTVSAKGPTSVGLAGLEVDPNAPGVDEEEVLE